MIRWSFSWKRRRSLIILASWDERERDEARTFGSERGREWFLLGAFVNTRPIDSSILTAPLWSSRHFDFLSNCRLWLKITTHHFNSPPDTIYSVSSLARCLPPHAIRNVPYVRRIHTQVTLAHLVAPPTLNDSRNRSATRLISKKRKRFSDEELTSRSGGQLREPLVKRPPSRAGPWFAGRKTIIYVQRHVGDLRRTERNRDEEHEGDG